MRRPLARTAALTVTVLVATGCGLPGSSAISTTTTGADPGGDRLPVQVPGESYGHHPRPLTGTLAYDESGCWSLDLGDGPRIVVFPEGFSSSEHDSSIMIGPDGESYGNGTEIDALGGIIASETLPNGSDGYWGDYLAFCSPERDEVVVTDSLEPAFNPMELPTRELADVVANVSLTESWGCGFGFTVTSEDQRVAVQVYPDEMQPTPGPVTLPDDDWTAEVLVGKHLAVNHCDDVIEGWEPEQVIAAQWPLTSGTLSFDLPAETECGLVGTVTATLKNASFETESGEQQLRSLTFVNDSFGCFAG